MMKLACTLASAVALTAASLAVLLAGQTVQPLPEPSSKSMERWKQLSRRTSGLDEGQLELFYSRGWLYLPGFLPSDDVRHLLTAVVAVQTSGWVSLLLDHVDARWQAIQYGASLLDPKIRDFWRFGPAATLAGKLLAGGDVPVETLLLADVVFSVSASKGGYALHSDDRSSFGLVSPEAEGISFWLALDDTDERTGGGIEFCSEADSSAATDGLHCTIYHVKAGDVIVFSKDALHRTVACRRGSCRSLCQCGVSL
eukprot:TRINITY_DN31413_c0_g1_i5.p1 TRINITY_DN31413_c0_g1~~TRINITY_DN31413_c0_g1_i5.p1  ORF type:complete len:255 (+),score=31.95 TRINITY_DN31413_c0_g1_i5:180-944(+)